MSKECIDFEEIVISRVDITYYVNRLCPEVIEMINGEYGSVDAYITEYISKNDNPEWLYRLFELLDSCNSHEQQLLFLRFGLIDGRAKTLEEVAKMLGITRDRARMIQRKALRPRCIIHRKRLKDYLED